MSENWANERCGEIQGMLLDDVFWCTLYSKKERIDDLEGLRDEINSMIKELKEKE